MNAILTTADFCPISQRHPAACVSIGFRRACAKFRERLFQKNGVTIDPPCRQLAKQVPPQVTPQPASPSHDSQIQPVKETAMPTNASKEGKCHSCGKTKKLVNHLGKRVCTACMPVRIAAKNNPEVVIAALREFGGLRDTGMKINDFREEIAKLSAENASLREKIALMPNPDNNLVGSICKHLLVGGRGVTIDIRPIHPSTIPA